MKKIYFLLIFSSLFIVANAQSEKFSRVKIFANDQQLKAIAGKGICVDHGQRKTNTWLITELSASEIALINSEGIQVEVLIDDVQQHYIQRNQSADKLSGEAEINSAGCNDNCSAWPIPQNFMLGNFAGFYTFQEVQDILDSMKAKFPSLITTRQSVGTGNTVEGRTIYYVKISDNPLVDESEPEILYNSLHHAREPESVSQLIYFMWYLLENYGNDSMITHLVNNTEMYFVPIVNPDGLEYNYLNSPSGGGMWRKNRKNNGDGTFGVDLNRNYSYQWGYNNTGSSPNTNSDTYRGPSAASEPETQLMADFVNTHDFRIAINNHCYSDVLIYPFGYEYNMLTPDSVQFSTYAERMTRCNGFAYGTPNQTVGYTGNGSIDDWLYADTVLRSKIISFTPEAGDPNDGFWPVISRIIPIAQNTMAQNMYALKLVGKLAEAESTDELFVNATTSFVHYDFRRIGMEPGTFTVSIIPVTSNILSPGSPVIYNNANLLQTISDSIQLNLSASNAGDLVSYVIAVNNGGFFEYDTVNRYFGGAVTAFADNCNAVSPQWTSSSWGVSTAQFMSATGSFTESVSGNYPNFSTRTITTVNYVNLTAAVAARIKFNAKWMLEAGFDYVQVQASTDGVNWTSLCGKYTHAGGGNQDPGYPLYDGFKTNWIEEEVDLKDLIGQNVMFRFRFKSDGGVAYDGFYFDDFMVEKITSVNAGIKSQEGENIVTVYPNPFQDELQIVIGSNFSAQNIKAEIYDLSGRMVYSAKINAPQCSVPLAHLENGMYVLKFKTEQSTISCHNIVKQ